MRRAYIVMTALPPTRGHEALIQFASRLDVNSVEVLYCSQPHEPWTQERYDSLTAIQGTAPIRIHRMHRVLPQEPDGGDPAYWDLWAGILTDAGITDNDYIVASEMYGKDLARITGARFMPYDIDRSILYTKATEVRKRPLMEFDQILPSFQRHLQKTITIFGAESTGKTTLAQDLAYVAESRCIPEWARPYLETVGPEITDQSMYDIWIGQRALQINSKTLSPIRPFVIQDTDLFSTVGYWDYMLPSETPQGLIDHAYALKSDLYIVTRSNIPFEPDPIRYGGDRRETEDHHWTDLLDKYELPYIVLESSDPIIRCAEAQQAINRMWRAHANLDFVREGKEYETV